MKVVIIKHFVSEELNWECGYYLVDGTIVIQNGEHWGAIPHMYNESIVECLCGITQKAKDAIKEALDDYYYNKCGWAIDWSDDND